MAEPPQHSNRRRLAWGAAIATLSALAAFGVASWQAQAAPSPGAAPGSTEPPRVSDPQPVPEGATGRGRDPLTGTEAQKARAAALSSGITGRPKDVTGEDGPELLSTDLVPGAQRRAEVFLYDYATDRVVKQVVDLDTGTVGKTYTAAGLQPPASEREVGEALELLLASPLRTRLTDAYRAATGSAFTQAGQVRARAHIYRARPADSGAEQCGTHRCVSLVVQTGTGGIFLDVRDVVIDLSGRTVARIK